jgi:hypothetical protein
MPDFGHLTLRALACQSWSIARSTSKERGELRNRHGAPGGQANPAAL